jgi:hypothetical protein
LDDRLVVTEQRLRLQTWPNVAIVGGAQGALPQGIFAGLTYFYK